MTKADKDTAVAFPELASSSKIQEAFFRFVNTRFKHHNPFFEGLAESLSASIQENPDTAVEMKRAIRSHPISTACSRSDML